MLQSGRLDRVTYVDETLMCLFFPFMVGKFKPPALQVFGSPHLAALSDLGKFKKCGDICTSVWVDKILNSKYY
jgi:hypothetical protein